MSVFVVVETIRRQWTTYRKHKLLFDVPRHLSLKGSTWQFSAVISVCVHEFGWNLYLLFAYPADLLYIQTLILRHLSSSVSYIVFQFKI